MAARNEKKKSSPGEARRRISGARPGALRTLWRHDWRVFGRVYLGSTMGKHGLSTPNRRHALKPSEGGSVYSLEEAELLVSRTSRFFYSAIFGGRATGGEDREAWKKGGFECFPSGDQAAPEAGPNDFEANR